MQDSKPLTTGRKVPDYVKSLYDSQLLAEKIQDYYKTLGYPDVKTWVEKAAFPSGRAMYSVRSNIVFNATKINPNNL